MKGCLTLFCFIASLTANAAPVEGTNYTVLPKPQPVLDSQKTEVIEFFAYNCVHCYDLDRLIMEWAKTKPSNVNFRRVHVVWGEDKTTGSLAHFFATMVALKLTDQLDQPAFSAILQNRIDLSDATTLENWLKTQPGVDVPKFMSVYSSFAVNADVSRARKMTKDYSIQGTPSIVINGRYALVSAAPKELIKEMNEMIAKVSAPPPNTDNKKATPQATTPQKTP